MNIPWFVLCTVVNVWLCFYKCHPERACFVCRCGKFLWRVYRECTLEVMVCALLSLGIYYQKWQCEQAAIHRLVTLGIVCSCGSAVLRMSGCLSSSRCLDLLLPGEQSVQGLELCSGVSSVRVLSGLCILFEGVLYVSQHTHQTVLYSCVCFFTLSSIFWKAEFKILTCFSWSFFFLVMFNALCAV